MDNPECGKERHEQISKGKKCAKKPPGVTLADACQVCSDNISHMTNRLYVTIPYPISSYIFPTILHCSMADILKAG